jgi:hypothetical protein
MLMLLPALSLGLGFARALHLWWTGIIISDEYGYLDSAWRGILEASVLAYRQAFAATNMGFVGLLRLDVLDRVVVALPLYTSLWSSITTLSLYLALRGLGYRGYGVVLPLLALVFTPAFLFLSLGFFSEGMSLAYASLSLYFLVRLLKGRSILNALPAAAFIWLAMRSREPYSLLFLSLFTVPLLEAWKNPAWRRLIVASIILLAVTAIGVEVVRDPAANMGVQSIHRSVDMMAAPLTNLFTAKEPAGGPGPPARGAGERGDGTPPPGGGPGEGGGGGSGGTTEPPPGGSGSSGPSQPPQGGSSGTSEQGSGSAERVPTQGVLAAIGVRYVPDDAATRALLLLFTALVTGYGPILPIFIAGLAYLVYQLVSRRRLRPWLPTLALVLLFLGTLGGVVLVFIGQPAYFGVRHYSTLLRFSHTSLLALPLAAAPLLHRFVGDGRRVIALAAAISLVYVPAAPLLAQAATSNLNPYENPLQPQLFPERAFGLYLRDYLAAHPGPSPIHIIGLSPEALRWTPGLSGRPDIRTHPYAALEGGLASGWEGRVYLYIPPAELVGLRERNPVVWRLIEGQGGKAVSVILSDPTIGFFAELL